MIKFFLLFTMIASVFMYYSIKTSDTFFKTSSLICSILCFITSIILFSMYVGDLKDKLGLDTSPTIFTKPSEMLKVPVEQKVSNLIIEEPNINKQEAQLEAPLMKQLPELPRGCEITSLGMLLAFNDIHVDKLELADNIKRNPAIFERRGDKTYFGNPNNGFVGDMLSFDTPGLGVYHKPIAELAKQYAADMTVHDFTGEDFSAVEEQISLGRPVWVIINSHYNKLPESEFITWYTEDGPIEVTYREHSVLLTGFDQENVYFNDPLDQRSEAPKENFIEAWIQMGKQAITIY
ncbi:C39 family peptidase [Pseudogracilibacillus sp. SO30301A]|uniref:C39 family peptidase n=1 Tax=Pseudogracilibacillus sp. SO30301A TaxID=3098291 RepID=UPI00300E62AC